MTSFSLLPHKKRLQPSKGRRRAPGNGKQGLDGTQTGIPAGNSSAARFPTRNMLNLKDTTAPDQRNPLHSACPAVRRHPARRHGKAPEVSLCRHSNGGCSGFEPDFLFIYSAYNFSNRIFRSLFNSQMSIPHFPATVNSFRKFVRGSAGGVCPFERRARTKQLRRRSVSDLFSTS